MKKEMNIEGMTCTSCSALVTDELSETEGISNVNVDLEGKKATFEIDEDKVSMEKVKELVSGLGFTPSL